MRRTLAVFLVLSACHRSEPAAGQEDKAAQDAAPVQVKTAVVEQRPMPRFLVVTGTLKAQQEAELAANTNGRVVEQYVERGTQVRKGDPLVRLDTRSAMLGEEQASAQAALARKNADYARQECTRADELFKAGTIPEAEYDRRKNACSTSLESARAAQAGAALARKGVSDATVRAPFSGVVGERFVTLGQFVHPETKVASVVSIDPLRLEISVPESNVGQVSKGANVEFLVAAYPDEIFTGTVRFVSPMIRPQTRDLIVEAVVPNKEGKLRAGMFAEVKLNLGEENLPVAPEQALRRGEVASSVFAVIDGKAEERVVQLGEARDGVVALRSGVKPGEKLIVDPGERVRDGVRVQE